MATRVRRRSIRDLRVILAEYMVGLSPGQRLPSIRELASANRMSLGSVSAALKELQEMGAVRIENHGHLGSTLEEFSLGKLWNLIQQGPLVVALSLPMHSHFEGLATGIKRAFENVGIETYFIFIRGSGTRLKALKENRCHVSVLSGLAAEKHCQLEDKIILMLPPGSWLSGYCVFYRTPAPPPGHPLRVAVDQDSSDHQYLSSLEFDGQQVEYKVGSYMQISRLLRNGDVDAAIWTVDQADSFLIPGVQHRPISDRVRSIIGEKSIAAAFVARADNATVRAVVSAAICPQEILAIQEKVSSGEMIPEY